MPPDVVQPWWVTPLVTIMVAVIGVGGTWLTVNITRKYQERASLLVENKDLRHENDRLRARVIRLMNYAGRLRDAHYRGDPPPPEQWPEGLYDDDA